MRVNPSKLLNELEQAGIPVDGCSSDGRIDFGPDATDQQKIDAAAILAAHNPDTPLNSDIDRQADLDALKPGVVNAALDSIQEDIQSLAPATNAEFRQIVGRILVRQSVIIKALRRLV